MERESGLAYESLPLQVLHIVPDMEPVIAPVVLLHQAMEQIAVEVSCAGPFEARHELLLGCLLVPHEHPGIELCRKLESGAVVARDERLLRGLLGPWIHIGRIELAEACLKEEVDHFLHLADIDAEATPGRPHEAEAELRICCNLFFIHSIPLSWTVRKA